MRGLEVEHVVILGHALCGGIAALVDGRDSVFASFDYLSTWTSVARETRDVVVREMAGLMTGVILAGRIGAACSLVAAGIAFAYFVSPLIGLKKGEGRRTFSVACGLQNYGFA